MAQTLKQKLRKVDRKLAKIDRKLGFLEGRLFFKRSGASTFEEVPLVPPDNGSAFVDQGISSRQVNGVEISGHRFSFTVDGDWWETNRDINGAIGVRGLWEVQRKDEDTTRFRVTIENQVNSDDSTAVQLTARVVETEVRAY